MNYRDINMNHNHWFPPQGLRAGKNQHRLAENALHPGM